MLATLVFSINGLKEDLNFSKPQTEIQEDILNMMKFRRFQNRTIYIGFNIINSLFSSIFFWSNGGAVYINDYLHNVNVNVENCWFLYCGIYATQKTGGAIFIESRSASINLTCAYACEANGHGQFVHAKINSEEFKFSLSVIYKCSDPDCMHFPDSLTNSPAHIEGIISSHSARISSSIQDLNITHCIINNRTGCLRVTQYKEMKVSNCLFAKNLMENALPDAFIIPVKTNMLLIKNSIIIENRGMQHTLFRMNDNLSFISLDNCLVYKNYVFNIFLPDLQGQIRIGKVNVEENIFFKANSISVDPNVNLNHEITYNETLYLMFFVFLPNFSYANTKTTETSTSFTHCNVFATTSFSKTQEYSESETFSSSGYFNEIMKLESQSFALWKILSISGACLLVLIAVIVLVIILLRRRTKSDDNASAEIVGLETFQYAFKHEIVSQVNPLFENPDELDSAFEGEDENENP